MREFTLAAEEAAAELQDMLPGGKQIEFKVAGQKVVAHPPRNSGPIFRFMMHANDGVEAAGAFKDLLPQIMDEGGARIIDDSLKNAEIGQGTLMEIMSYLMEEWSARPTSSPRGSSSRRRTTGNESTGSAPSPG